MVTVHALHAGVRGLQENGTFVKYSVIGVYLENVAVPWLAVKWKGKTAEELKQSNDFFTDIITGNYFSDVHTRIGVCDIVSPCIMGFLISFLFHRSI